MKPSGSSSRRQRSPTSRRSTYGDRGARCQCGRGRREDACPPPPTYTWEKGPHKGGDGAAREPQGRKGSTCWRGDLSAGRLELSVEDMPVQRGRGAALGLGSLARRLRGPRSRWGLLTRRGERERWRSASGRRRPGIQAGEVGRGGAAGRCRRGHGRLAAPAAAESPRARFKLLSSSRANLAAESRGVRSGTLLPPPLPAPLSARRAP